MAQTIPRVALAVAIAATGVLAPGLAAAHAHSSAQSGGGTIVLSCYRGPWEEVIWDRPNPEFIDSLTAIGYNIGDAQGIGERVCRDPAGVNNPSAATAILQRLLRENPPR